MASSRHDALSSRPQNERLARSVPGRQAAAASPCAAAVYIWHTCLGSPGLAPQMAGGFLLLLSSFMVEGEPTAVISHKERLIQPCC